MLYRTTSSPVFSLRREIDRLFDDTFGGEGTATARRTWIPAADVRETDGEYTFELELPGIAPEHVELTADDGVLTVRGEKGRDRARKEGDEGRWHVLERSYGSFVRAFQLPQGVDEDRIDARFANGLLTVRVPKAERPQPRRIRIAEGDTERRVSEAGANGSGDRARVEGPGSARRTEKPETAHAAS